jgi:broad specificity phosphatase PhoE
LTRVLLIRHASCDETGHRLYGRTPGVRLSQRGEAEAQRLGERLRETRLCAVYTSPVERAVQTATAVARLQGLLPVETAAFEEIDFGSWTGCTLDDLHGDPEWELFNTMRSCCRIPAGELMLETQARSLSGLLELLGRHEGETFAVVSHADVIRTLLAHLLGMPVDNVLRLAVAPASVSMVQFHGRTPQLEYLNRVES